MAAKITGTLPMRAKAVPAQGNPGQSSAKPAVQINIATPAYRSTYAGVYMTSIFDLLGRKPANVGFSFSSVDYADIVMSRNYLISNFYYHKPDCDYLLFLDNDMGFKAELIAQMLALNQDVVGVIYPKRTLDLRQLQTSAGQDYDAAYAKACSFIGTPLPGHPILNGFAQVDRIGTGILLISRKAIDRMITTLPEIVDGDQIKGTPFASKFENFLTPFNKVVENGRELSEDFSFCHRWVKGCGGSIYANVNQPVKHVAEIVIETSYMASKG
ncbi:MAG: hypothetical protein Q7J57_08695 [Gemmobacter sp.]|nr:hypothetical protein [Gemmobacter sp.]